MYSCTCTVKCCSIRLTCTTPFGSEFKREGCKVLVLVVGLQSYVVTYSTCTVYMHGASMYVVGGCCCDAVHVHVHVRGIGGQHHLQGAISVLVKYTAMVQEHVLQVLPLAAAVAAHSGWHFCLAAHALSGMIYCAWISVSCVHERV